MKEKMTQLRNQLEESKKLVSGIVLVTLLFFTGVAFFGLGGADRVGSLFSSIKIPQVFGSSGGSGNLGAADVKFGKTFTQEVLKTSIVQKRNSLQGKSPPVRTGIILDPTKGELALLTKVGTRNAAQFSDGSIGILSEADVFRLEKQGLSKQDISDIEALDARRQRFIDAGGNPNIKRTGKELVIAKRLQAELAKQSLTARFGKGTFFEGKLFGNPNFGKPSDDPRNLSVAERNEIKANIIKNKRIARARDEAGKRIAAELRAKNLTDKQAARLKGANIIGGNQLNDRARAKLRERGLI